MKSTCVLVSAGLPPPADRHCCCPACAHQAVADALVLMQTGRALAARRVLEALEEDLSQVAVLTRALGGLHRGRPRREAELSRCVGVARTWAAAKREGEDEITEREVTALLADFATVWNELFPAEQVRIVQLLVERVDVLGDVIELRIRGEGLASLVGELRQQDERRAA